MIADSSSPLPILLRGRLPPHPETGLGVWADATGVIFLSHSRCFVLLAAARDAWRSLLDTLTAILGVLVCMLDNGCDCGRGAATPQLGNGGA
jgi:hypothetical protein